MLSLINFTGTESVSLLSTAFRDIFSRKLIVYLVKLKILATYLTSIYLLHLQLLSYAVYEYTIQYTVFKTHYSIRNDVMIGIQNSGY